MIEIRDTVSNQVEMKEFSQTHGPQVKILHSAAPKQPSQVSFHRKELDVLLQLYSRKVASGEWRDYAIDMLRDRAVFSVFRKTSEVPLFMIEKTPALARRQGAWSVTNSNGFILKRGHELKNVVKVLERIQKQAFV